MKTKRLQIFNDATTPDKPEAKPWFKVVSAMKPGEEHMIEIFDQIGVDWWTGDGLAAKAFADELKKIPKHEPMCLRIDSPGGSVDDGMLIYNLLDERRANLRVKVMGRAYSIASVIALAGKSLEMPRNTMLMIHEPWTVAKGSAKEMRQAAAMLDKYGERICAVYERKTKKPMHEIKKCMEEETYFTGEDAKNFGFADSVTEEISIQAAFDSTRFVKAPLGWVAKPSAKREDKESNIMNRTQMLALLRGWGVTVEDSMTDEALIALVQAGKPEPAPKVEPKPKAKAKAKPAPVVDDADDEPVDDPEPAPSPRNQGPSAASLAATEKRLKDIEARYDGERKTRITAVVDQCITEDRIPGAQRDKWIARAIADEEVLNDLRHMPSRPPGVDAIAGIEITSEEPLAIANSIVELRAPLASMLKGNNVRWDVVAASQKRCYAEIAKHRKRLEGVMNTNTIDANLQRQVIFSDGMRDYRRRLIPLNIFTTRFTNVPLEGTDKVTMPYYANDTTASKTYVDATGYEFDGDTAVSSREVTINKRKYQPMDFYSVTLRRQPYFNPMIHLGLKFEQLALDVVNDVLSIVTAANYTNVVDGGEPDTFDTDDVITIRKKCQNLEWPDVARSLLLSHEHEAGLLSDAALKGYLNSGSTEPLREGATGRLLGFNLYYSPRIPTNSEDLGGFACLPQSVLVATAPIAPAPGVLDALLAYELVTDPETGMTFEYRYGADVWKDKQREVIECNYGYNYGQQASLVRITNGAATNSSSSSASSVNSSSSSSS